VNGVVELEARQRVALLAELRNHAAVDQWQAVPDVEAEHIRFDPSVSESDGHATGAAYQLGELVRRPSCTTECVSYRSRCHNRTRGTPRLRAYLIVSQETGRERVSGYGTDHISGV
jgi:hypothetical protein